MTVYSHPQRETYPIVSSDDTLVTVCRDSIVASLRPIMYVKARTPAEIRFDESRSLDDRAGYEVVDWTVGAGATITITVNGGAPTVLTEGIDFTAAISNFETAIRIASAINTAALGLLATFTTGAPFVYITPQAGVKEFTLDSSNHSAWTQNSLANIGGLVTLAASEHMSVITFGLRSPLDQVGFLRVLSGSVSVDIRSPLSMRTYFQQPATLNQNTGHPGGWPSSP